MRALVLREVAVYAFVAPPRDALEQMISEWPVSERQAFAKDAVEKRDEFWARLGRLREAMSPWERAYAESTMLTMSQQQQVDASWRTEAFQVLAWALGAIQELPAFDVEADHEILRQFPPVEPESFVTSARLRPAPVLAAARDLAELWHWRSRTRALVERGDPFPASPQMRATGFASYDDVVRMTVSKASAEGRVESIAQDFAAFGKAYRDMSPSEWAVVRSITAERHFALNWLCGHAEGNRWDDTPTDT